MKTLMVVDVCMKMFASLGILTYVVPYISVRKLSKCVCLCRGLKRRRRGKRGFSARGAWKSRLSGESEAKWLQPDCAAV